MAARYPLVLNGTTIQELQTGDTLAGPSSGGIGATGGGTDAVFLENDIVVSQNYTLGSGAYILGVTITIATPGVFTLNSHNLISGSQVHLSTTGALPTGLSVDTVYYILSAGLTTNVFEVSLTLGGTAITTSGTQSGTHSIGKIKNAVSAGPIVVADGVTITIPNGSTWVIE